MREALVIVDFQNDFSPGGALAVPEGDAIAPRVRERGIDRVTIVGLATDYCVRATALDALREGFAVEVDRAGVRGIEAQRGDIERALDEVASAGGHVTDS